MLEIEMLSEQSAAGAIQKADRRLYLAADEKTIVEEGSKHARFLLVGKGGSVPAADAKRLGLSVVDGKIVQGAPVAAAPTPEPEPAPAPEAESAPGVLTGDTGTATPAPEPVAAPAAPKAKKQAEDKAKKGSANKGKKNR